MADKELVVAERVHLRLKEEIFVFVCLAVLTVLAITGFSLIFFPVVCIFVGFSIILLEVLWFTTTVVHIVENNAADPKLLTYKNGVFTLRDIKQTVTFKKTDIIDMLFKRKRDILRGRKILQDSDDNYGKLVIWYKIDDNNIFRLTLKDVMLQKTVFDEIFENQKETKAK